MSSDNISPRSLAPPSPKGIDICNSNDNKEEGIEEEVGSSVVDSIINNIYNLDPNSTPVPLRNPFHPPPGSPSSLSTDISSGYIYISENIEDLPASVLDNSGDKCIKNNSTNDNNVNNNLNNIKTNQLPSSSFPIPPQISSSSSPLISSPTTSHPSSSSEFPLPSAKEAVVVEDVLPRPPHSTSSSSHQTSPLSSSSLASLLPLVSSLSLKCFQEDVCLLVTRRSGWRLNLLVAREGDRTHSSSSSVKLLDEREEGEVEEKVNISRMREDLNGKEKDENNNKCTNISVNEDLANEEDVDPSISSNKGEVEKIITPPLPSVPPPPRLLGFLSYRINAPSNVLEISKLAICDDCRHRGYGRRLVKHIINIAKTYNQKAINKQAGRYIEYIALSSLEEAVKFYEHLGFRKFSDISFRDSVLAEGEEIVPGQIYMEMKLKREGGGRTGKCGSQKRGNYNKKKKN